MFYAWLVQKRKRSLKLAKKTTDSAAKLGSVFIEALQLIAITPVVVLIFSAFLVLVVSCLTTWAIFGIIDDPYTEKGNEQRKK